MLWHYVGKCCTTTTIDPTGIEYRYYCDHGIIEFSDDENEAIVVDTEQEYVNMDDAGEAIDVILDPNESTIVINDNEDITITDAGEDFCGH